MSDTGDNAMFVSKTKIRVVAMVEGWRIEGDLHILTGSRLTDSLNTKTKDFLAVTDASIFDGSSGSLVFQTPYLALNRDAITMIFLAD